VAPDPLIVAPGVVLVPLVVAVVVLAVVVDGGVELTLAFVRMNPLPDAELGAVVVEVADPVVPVAPLI